MGFIIYIDLELSKTSKALLRNTTLFYYDPLSYSHAFRAYARSYAANIVSPYNKDKIQINNYYTIFFFFDHIKHQNTDLKNVIETMQGYLKLHLSKFNNAHKELDKIWINSNEYYIMSGSYITPFSSSLIKNEQ